MFGKEECPVIGEPIFENKPSNDEYVSDHRETIRLQRSFGTAAERARRNMNAKLANPLAGYTQEELRQQGINFAITHQMGDEEDVRAFAMGAMLAQVPERYAEVPGLTPQELAVLENEYAHRWSQPWTMYLVICLCSLSAAVQGMGKSKTFLNTPDVARHRLRQSCTCR